jgi:DNA mismatch repair protein MutS
MSIIVQYLRLQKKHEADYGERTVVLMQIGTFLECYQYDITYCTTPEAKVDKEGNIWNESIGHAIELSVVLNSILTQEDKGEPYGITNPHKVGFPIIAYEKNLATLLANDFVVVRYDQDKDTTGKVTRHLAEVQSPTMQMDNITLTRATSNVACVYIEYHKGLAGVKPRYDNFVITTGAAVVDVITGQNRVCEFYSKAEDQIHAVQELYRFLISHYPRELIVHVNDMPPGFDQHTDVTPNPYVKYLERILELRRFDRLTVHVNAVPADYKKIPYQIEALNKVFRKPTVAPAPGLRLNIIQKRNDRIIEELGLERMNYGRIAYMLLMQHCYAHNPEIIARLAKPDLQWLDEQRHLILAHNAIVQLDLVPNQERALRARKKAEIDSLMAVLDHNQTHLGRRVLNTLLQNPMLDPTEIRTYYDMVDEMSRDTEQKEPLWLILDRQLKELPDVGRLQRKLEIKLISPKELAVLYGAYTKVISIYVTVMQTKSPVLHSQMLNPADVAGFNEFMARFGAIIDFAALECCHVDTSESGVKWMEFADCPFKAGCYPDLDEQTRNLVAMEATLQAIVDHLNGFLAHTRGKKIEFKSAKKKQGAKKQDPTETILTTTVAKANELSTARIDVNLCGTLQVLPHTTSERMLTSDRIMALTSGIDQIRGWMRQRLLAIYDSLLDEMVNKYTFYAGMANLIAKLDLIHSYAKVTKLYSYYRPDIIMTPAGAVEASYLEARELRHPIIERIIDGVYVTNDIALGIRPAGLPPLQPEIPSSQGGLIFGVNQVGKSSLTKAVALMVVMAQIGCFVPARLRYIPYANIITRITGTDRMLEHKSTFAVELEELRTMLRQAKGRTLGVGDEIAHGTETHSGMAITGSALLSLIKSRSSFLFATHMHELLDLSSIKAIPPNTMRVCHLSISYDETTKTLIYDRKLREGAGASIYGLMVARSLDLPAEFIDQAHVLLHEITGANTELVATNTSRYNREFYPDTCAMCGRSRAQVQIDTHHIIEQGQADDKQMVHKVIKAPDGTFIEIGAMHKNAKDNLIGLCRDCHVTLHKQKKELEAVTIANGTLIRVKPEQIVRQGLILAVTA